MKIIHTSDWHFGKVYSVGRDYEEDQRFFIDRLCELFIGEKPIILERSMVGRYLRKAEADIYNQLYGESPYDVTLLINSKAEPEKRRFLF